MTLIRPPVVSEEVLITSLIPTAFAAAQPGRTKVLLHDVSFRPELQVSEAALSALGAKRVRDYEAFTLATIPTTSIDGFTTAAAARDLRAEVFDEWDTVRTPGYTIDARNPVLPPAGLIARYPDGRGLYVIQFDGPTSADTIDDLRAAGCTYVGYIPYNAALVVADETIIADLQVRTDVQWVSIYHPGFKAQPPFTWDSSLVEYTIQVAAAPGSERTEEAIRAAAGPNVTESRYGDLHNFFASLSPTAAADLISNPYVVAVEQRSQPALSGERDAIGVTLLVPSGCTAQPYAYQCKASYTDPRTGQASTYVAPHKSSSGFTGWLNSKPIFGSTTLFMLDTSGYKIAVADTGLDIGSPTTCHPDIGPCSRVQFTSYRPTTDPNYKKDNIGHGTMVTGMAAAYPTAETGTDVLTGYGIFSYGVGIAPKAKILSQQVIGNDGAPIFNANSSISIWANEAFSTYAASVQTHSWNDYDPPYPGHTGQANGGLYRQYAQDMDYAIADITYTPPTAGWKRPVTTAVGNICGAASDYHNGDCSTQVLAPATAKNAIAIGASESYRVVSPAQCDTANDPDPIKRLIRQPQDFWADSLNNIAYVSRRGTQDGRIKPDLVAPGTMVSSTRTYYHYNLVDQPKFCKNVDAYYSIDTGTSFSAPQAAGAAVLVDRYRNTTFSGPMIKAALIGSAISLKGGRDSYSLSTIAAKPNSVQGFGRINVDTILANSPVQTFLDEGSMAAFSGSGQVRSRTFIINNTAKTTTVVLAWSDYPATVNANPTLVRDLDISITTPSGGVFVGNSLSSSEVSIAKNPPDPSDTKNNVEMIVIPANSGLTTFTLDVSCKTYGGIGYQSYAIFVANAQ